ncbi:MAG: hypothetical protein KatS3mg003_1581 [Candidatus Nitrosocaldaceae archaeon]|nr:MAG: hypothetical protein KatS3mg003_1581 [Candidatus Nitrosocaldaceae archaeon]
MSYTERKRSVLWYLLPIFLGIIGGAIGYFAIRHDDPTMAKRMLILGIIVSAIGLIIGFSTVPNVQLPSANTNN